MDNRDDILGHLKSLEGAESDSPKINHLALAARASHALDRHHALLDKLDKDYDNLHKARMVDPDDPDIHAEIQVVAGKIKFIESAIPAWSARMNSFVSQYELGKIIEEEGGVEDEELEDS